jgi:hypothetical protein
MIDATKYAPTFRSACTSLKGEAYCSPTVVQALMAVSRHETCFSDCKPFVGAHNYGAIQCGVIADKAGKCPANCIPARDTSPTATGASIAYLGCFRAKPSAEEGIADFVRLMTFQRPLIAEALPSGDARQIAWAMRRSYYFEGFGKTQEERVENYATAIAKNAKVNASQLRQELLVSLPPLEEEGIGTVDIAAGSTAAGLLIAALLKRITKGSQE